MIRAYAIDMGTGTAALVMFPIYLITGEPIMGLDSNVVFVGMWLLNIAIGERVIRRLSNARPSATAVAPTIDLRTGPSTGSISNSEGAVPPR